MAASESRGWHLECAVTTRLLNCMDDALKDRAKRYRDIAAEVRMVAGGIADADARHGMLLAADVWDRLAGLAECRIDAVSPPHRKGLHQYR